MAPSERSNASQHEDENVLASRYPGFAMPNLLAQETRRSIRAHDAK